jgi:hypothetical protein
MSTAQRFHCPQADCVRRIFAKRLDPGAAAAYGRRTSRLDGVIHHHGVAFGVRPAQAIAQRLLLPVSNDTLLRTVRSRKLVRGGRANLDLLRARIIPVA